MKKIQVTQYESCDGQKFETEKDCINYEYWFNKVTPILDRIPSIKIEGSYYVQFDKEYLLQLKRELFYIVLEYLGKEWPEWKKFNPDEVHPMSIVGRVLDDYGGPVAEAWQKLEYFNFDLGRKYEQPYFALNPEKANNPYQK
jgi:hypothetical protein